jgi:hypothetical protein
MSRWIWIFGGCCLVHVMTCHPAAAQFDVHIDTGPPIVAIPPIGGGLGSNGLGSLNSGIGLSTGPSPLTGITPIRPNGLAITPVPSLGPGPGGGLGGGPGPTANLATAFVVSVCTYQSSFTDECWSQGWNDALSQLNQIYLKLALGEIATNTLTVRFPTYARTFDQLNFLQKVERKAAATVVSILQRDVARLTPFEWRVEDNRAINEWAIRSDTRAATGANWSHDWSNNSHTFRLGPAFHQLQSISLHGSWGGN